MNEITSYLTGCWVVVTRNVPLRQPSPNRAGLPAPAIHGGPTPAPVIGRSVSMAYLTSSAPPSPLNGAWATVAADCSAAVRSCIAPSEMLSPMISTLPKAAPPSPPPNAAAAGGPGRHTRRAGVIVAVVAASDAAKDKKRIVISLLLAGPARETRA